MAHQQPPPSMNRTLQASQRTAQVSHHLTKMATPASHAAPWRSLFLEHISKLKSPSFTLSTLHPVEASASSTFSFTPRARTVIFRGMWTCLDVNPKNPAELNPEGLYESDLLTITSDARMEKVPELLRSKKEAVSEADPQSGQGGPFEAVFWVVETSTQWRIRGHTVVIGPDIDSPSHKPARDSILHHMRLTSSSQSQPPFSFSRELTVHFGNLSPGMRGSFRNPPPGTPLKSGPLEPGLGLGQKVEDLEDEIARENFRVVVLVPEEVDRVDLSDPEEGKRWNYRLEEGGEEVRTWKVTELWP